MVLLDRRPSFRPESEFIYLDRFTIGREIKMQKIMTHFVLCVGAQMILQLKRRRLDLRWLFYLRFLHTTHTFEVILVYLRFI